ncbi:hypothetical protein T439DRAFT_221449 [Meredithblackwellia eburnea MCA 4105]
MSLCRPMRASDGQDYSLNSSHSQTGAPHNREIRSKHSLLLAFGYATLLHVWMGARSTRRHAHASTALMELIYATIAISSCLPIFPRHYGSSISLIGAIPNFIFPLLICWKGGIGIKDFVALVSGDGAIGERDRKLIVKTGAGVAKSE